MKMTEAQKIALKLSKEKIKPILVFNGKNYKIEKIPLNFKIIIKCEKKNNRQKIERDWYSFIDYGVEEAHKIADYAIAEFFKKDQMPINPFADR